MDEPCSALDPISTRVVEADDRRARAGDHDRDRDAQHATGGARLAPVRVLPRRGAGRTRAASSRSARPRRCSSRPTTRARSTTSRAGSDEMRRVRSRGRRAGSGADGRRCRCVPAAYAGGSSILGGGSGFAALEIDQWRADTARSPYNLTVNYVVAGLDVRAPAVLRWKLRLRRLRHPVPAGGDTRPSQSRRCSGKPQPPDNRCFVYVPGERGRPRVHVQPHRQLGQSHHEPEADPPGRVQDLHRRDHQVERSRDRRDQPAVRARSTATSSPIVRTDGAGESYVFSEFCIAVAPASGTNFVNQQKTVDPELTQDFLAGQPTSVWPQQAWGVSPVRCRDRRRNRRLRGRPDGRSERDHVRRRGVREGSELPDRVDPERGRRVHATRRGERDGRARLRNPAAATARSSSLQRPRSPPRTSRRRTRTCSRRRPGSIRARARRSGGSSVTR